MIEMRWISVPGVHGRGLFYGKDGQVGEMVLQYREGESEWKDVPFAASKLTQEGK